VKIPDPAEQWKKTPIKRKVVEEYENPETGERIKVPRWIWWIEQTGEETVEILHLNDIRDRFLPANQRTEAEMQSILKEAGGIAKRDSKKGILAGFIELYIRPISQSEYKKKGLADFEAEIEKWFKLASRWGLGCPYNCGRFWEFKPSSDLSNFQPVDLLAMSSTDEQGNLTNGYLKWQPQANGSVKFICDNCKGIILLSK